MKPALILVLLLAACTPIPPKPAGQTESGEALYQITCTSPNRRTTRLPRHCTLRAEAFCEGPVNVLKHDGPTASEIHLNDWMEDHLDHHIWSTPVHRLTFSCVQQSQ